jgi:hypothetical protein
MKRIALGILLSTLLGTAQAGILTIDPGSTPVIFAGYDGQPATVTGPKTTGSLGSLSVDSAGIFSATYLGNESGFTDKYTLAIVNSLLETNNLGDTISAPVVPGLVDFSFSDNQGFTFSNGTVPTPVLGFAILSGATNQFGPFDFILGFNDSFSQDADYDDFVVGVKFVSAPVPEPETYAMMMAGLGLIGFMARRRRNKG